MGDNDFELLPPEVGQLKNLQIVRLIDYSEHSIIINSHLMAILILIQLVLRENDLIALPKEVGELSRLRELHIQGNRLTILPPEVGKVY